MICIIDYGAGNIKSIRNMLKKLGYDSVIGSDMETIEKADKLILPGVGHFDHGMNQLKSSGMIPIIERKALKEKVPFLGICLGSQMLGNKSEEGAETGLGWIDMEVVRFDKTKADDTIKIPHMGWNYIHLNRPSPLTSGLDDDARFYFVHAFHMKCNDESDIICSTDYGYNFTSAVEKDNLFGVQFHPEKSHRFGKKLLENFAKL